MQRRRPRLRRVASHLSLLALAALSVAVIPARSAAATSDTHRHILLWANCYDVAALTNQQLDQWQSMGIGGFVCQTGNLEGLGGSQLFTAQADPDDSQHALETQLDRSNLAARLHARHMQIYLGFYLTNYFNTQTPLGTWFDDNAWFQQVLPAVRNTAAAAHRMGMDGVAFDEELYAQENDSWSASWSWDYPGNTHTEAQVRAAAERRGREMMGALLRGFPGVSIVDYDAHFPGTWAAHVQAVTNHDPHAYRDSLQINFWNGLTAVRGYDQIRFLDASFYKDTGVAGTGWGPALTYSVNNMYGVLSRRLSNWRYAASRVTVSPFAWIDGTTTSGNDWGRARDPQYVADQLSECAKWSPNGDFAIYSNLRLGQFNYQPYAAAMREAAQTAATPTSGNPALRVDLSSVAVQHGSVTATGLTHDPLAIKVVRWASDGSTGTARLVWQPTGGSSQTGYRWHTVWTITHAPMPSATGHLTVWATDISGRVSALRILVSPRGAKDERVRLHRG